jgi:hypothetical protein
MRSPRGRKPPSAELKEYLSRHVFGRCGQAVSRLAEAGLVPRPELASSEDQIHEWWLVSAELAERLHAAGLPVLQFAELHMWGRFSSGGALEDDAELIAAVHPLRP